MCLRKVGREIEREKECYTHAQVAERVVLVLNFIYFYFHLHMVFSPQPYKKPVNEENQRERNKISDSFLSFDKGLLDNYYFLSAIRRYLLIHPFFIYHE